MSDSEQEEVFEEESENEEDVSDDDELEGEEQPEPTEEYVDAKEATEPEEEEVFENDVVQFKADDIKETVKSWHPQESIPNWETIRPLLTVHRTEGEQVVDDQHHSFFKLTKFEFTKILGLRKQQLDGGAEAFLETDLTDTYQIALEEMRQKLLPFVICRPFPTCPDYPPKMEYFRLSDLENLNV
jgi:DNA-directed RNA polymerase subunit K/omega